jgi:16S rRNA (cytidine1402-2'-O)-methyltransferase
MENGALYIVTTPIGNLEDITLRALRILGEVDLIAAEDTRHTRKLLSHFEISTRMVSYHTHNEHRKTEQLLDQVVDGVKIAMVSDAGTPGIADPGFLLVREAVKRGIEPIIIPGVSSLTFAAAAAGLPIDKFSFYGFLPIKQGKKANTLRQIADSGQTGIIFESPHRITKTLNAIANEIGEETPVAVVREATKLYEEILRGSAAELAAANSERKWKGECVIVISPVTA